MRIIAGEFKGRPIKTSPGPGYRPAMSKVRQALFSMLEARGVTWPLTRVLDVFAGSGSLGFEALSRGAPFACFVDSDAKSTAFIRENAKKFGLSAERYHVHTGEARPFLGSRSMAPFELIFIDPPYRGNFLSASLTAVLRHDWLAPGGFVSAEVERSLAFDPEVDFPSLDCLIDRIYGQTRVVVWSC